MSHILLRPTYDDKTVPGRKLKMNDNRTVPCPMAARDGTMHGFCEHRRLEWVSTMYWDVQLVFCGGVDWKPIVVKDRSFFVITRIRFSVTNLNEHLTNLIQLDGQRLEPLFLKLTDIFKLVSILFSKLHITCKFLPVRKRL